MSLRKLLKKLGNSKSTRRGRMNSKSIPLTPQLENLEARQLMTADLDLFATVGQGGDNAFQFVELSPTQDANSAGEERSLGYAGYRPSMDSDPLSGLLYSGQRDLVETNPTTNEVRKIGRFTDPSGANVSLRSLSFSPDGTLYGLASDMRSIYRVEVNTAAVSQIGQLERESTADYAFAIEFADDGTLFAAGVSLMTVDLTNVGSAGSNTELLPIHRVSRLKAYVTELDFTPDGRLLGLAGATASNGMILEIDPTSGIQTPFARFTSDLTAIASTAGVSADELPAPVAEEVILIDEAFESGAVDASIWEIPADNAGRIRVTAGRLQMDAAPQYTFPRSHVLNEAILHVDLAGRRNAKLTFDHDSLGDENSAIPRSFTGSKSGDGVSISADGITWHRLISLRADFISKEFDLDAAIRHAGIEFTADFQIKFQQYDNYHAPIDGRAFDNIRVTADDQVINRAPMIEPVSRIMIREGETANSVDVKASDADGDTPQFTLTEHPSFVSLKDNNDGTATLQFAKVDYDSSGSYGITIKVTDPNGAFTTRTTTVVVENVNRGPQLSAISNVVVGQNERKSFIVQANDPDTADRLTYSMSGPSFATINSRTGEVTIEPGDLLPQDHAFEVTVQDESGAKSSRSFTVAVPQPNRAPLLSAPEKVTVHEGTGGEFKVLFSDPDHHKVTLKIEGLAEIGGFHTQYSDRAIISLAPGFDAAGFHRLKLTATDGTLTTTQTIDVEVKNVLLVSELVGQTTEWGTVEAARKDVHGTVFAFTDEDNLLRYGINGLSLERADVSQVVSDVSGNVFIRRATNVVELWTGTKWQLFHGNAARLLVDGNGDVFVHLLNENREIRRWDGAAFLSFQDGAWIAAVDNDGDVVGWKQNGSFADHWNFTENEELSSIQLRSITSNGQGQMFALTSDNRVVTIADSLAPEREIGTGYHVLSVNETGEVRALGQHQTSHEFDISVIEYDSAGKQFRLQSELKAPRIAPDQQGGFIALTYDEEIFSVGPDLTIGRKLGGGFVRLAVGTDGTVRAFGQSQRTGRFTVYKLSQQNAQPILTLEKQFATAAIDDSGNIVVLDSSNKLYRLKPDLVAGAELGAGYHALAVHDGQIRAMGRDSERGFYKISKVTYDRWNNPFGLEMEIRTHEKDRATIVEYSNDRILVLSNANEVYEYSMTTLAQTTSRAIATGFVQMAKGADGIVRAIGNDRALYTLAASSPTRFYKGATVGNHVIDRDGSQVIFVEAEQRLYVLNNDLTHYEIASGIIGVFTSADGEVWAFGKNGEVYAMVDHTHEFILQLRIKSWGEHKDGTQILLGTDRNVYRIDVDQTSVLIKIGGGFDDMGRSGDDLIFTNDSGEVYKLKDPHRATGWENKTGMGTQILNAVYRGRDDFAKDVNKAVDKLKKNIGLGLIDPVFASALFVFDASDGTVDGKSEVLERITNWSEFKKDAGRWWTEKITEPWAVNINAAGLGHLGYKATTGFNDWSGSLHRLFGSGITTNFETAGRDIAGAGRRFDDYIVTAIQGRWPRSNGTASLGRVLHGVSLEFF